MIGVLVRGAVTLLVVVAAVAGVFYAGRCTADPHNPEQPPAVLSGSSTTARVDDAAPAGRFGLTEGAASVTRRGRTAPLPRTSPERRQTRRYVADVLATDSLPVVVGVPPESLPAADAPGLLPPVRAWRDDDTGALAVMDSRGAWRLEEYRCPDGRRWEAGTTADGAGFYGNCERAVPALLPDVARDVGICAGIGALAAGVAWGANRVNGDDEPLVRPLEAGIGGTALCGAVVLVRRTL